MTALSSLGPSPELWMSITPAREVISAGRTTPPGWSCRAPASVPRERLRPLRDPDAVGLDDDGDGDGGDGDGG